MTSARPCLPATPGPASLLRPALPPCSAFLSQVAVYDSPVAHMDMVRLLIPGVMALVPLFDEGVRKRDDDQAKGIARVFAETGESYVDLILGEEEISQVCLPTHDPVASVF